MRILKKIKKNNGRFQIYLFGLKIFSYKRKKIIVGNNTLQYNGKNVTHIPGLDVQFMGENSSVLINGQTVFNNSFLKIKNNCSIIIDESKHIIHLKAWLGESNKLTLGENFASASLQIHAEDSENLQIEIGKECLCSDNVEIWGTDGHTIFDCVTKKCINIPKYISIGSHVWLCKGVTILKNSIIPDHCIVARNSIVTESSLKNISDKKNISHCVLGGIPAKIIKTNVDWDSRPVAEYCKEQTITI